jgi:hypothetical protein
MNESDIDTDPAPTPGGRFKKGTGSESSRCLSPFPIAPSGQVEAPSPQAGRHAMP